MWWTRRWAERSGEEAALRLAPTHVGVPRRGMCGMRGAHGGRQLCCAWPCTPSTGCTPCRPVCVRVQGVSLIRLSTEVQAEYNSWIEALERAGCTVKVGWGSVAGWAATVATAGQPGGD